MVKRRFNEAVNGGWEVDEREVFDAYYLACEKLGKEYVDDQIVDTLSDDELASSLAYLFRMWEFREWDEWHERKEDDEFDESVNRRRKRRISERLTYNSVGFDNLSSRIDPTRYGYSAGIYDSEDGYMEFTKTCGDFDVTIYSWDNSDSYTVYVTPKRGNVDLNWLERELGDIDFTDVHALDELEDRLIALSGSGVTAYGESRQRRNKHSKVRTESVRRNRKFIRR